MTDIHIPPAALEAGARALCEEARLFWPDLTGPEHDIMRAEARAAFFAMVKAWPGMNAKAATDHVMLLNSTPALILPLTEKTDG